MFKHVIAFFYFFYLNLYDDYIIFSFDAYNLKLVQSKTG